MSAVLLCATAWFVWHWTQHWKATFCSLHSDKVVYLLPQIVDRSQTHLILRVAAIFICNFMATTSKPLSFENLHPK